MEKWPMQPTVFVVMPYGVKRDPTSGMEIDFDDIWRHAFLPAATQAGVDPVRADEERIGGFVHLAMFERLLLAEIVLADLTLASPNVMYELGIRHATRPRATIPVFARVGQLPFDLSPIRALSYRLNRKGRLVDKSRRELVSQLSDRLRVALTETAADSPLFQLINSYPGVNLPHDVTETFQERVQTVVALSREIRMAALHKSREEGLGELRRLGRQMEPFSGMPTDLLLDLLLAYRDVEAFDDLLSVAENLPGEVAQHAAVRQVVAFAFNRRNKAGDDQRAIEVLEDMLKERGADPETLGLLGRIHKDRHRRLVDVDPFRASAALESAIDAYERGFKADIRDYYPGINAVTLLMLEGSEEGYHRARELSPVVAFAVAARGGLDSKDYWDLATVLQLAVVNLDIKTAQAAIRRMLYRGGPTWRRRTVIDDVERVREAHSRRGVGVEWINELLDRLKFTVDDD